jgi:hypothetical protein
MRHKPKNRSKAQSIIETVVGIIFLIPIVLLMFDVGVLVLANTSNDNLAKQAARAAAGAAGTPNAPPGNVSFFNNAKLASAAVVSRYANNTGAAAGSVNNQRMFAGVKLEYMNYYDSATVSHIFGAKPPGALAANPGLGNVEVYTSFVVQCPVAFPGFDGKKTFYARAVEPIVSQPP